MSKEGKKRVRVRVSGRVQGVFFRASTAQMANDLGLAGWVKNRCDGSVEALFEGDAVLVNNAVSWCREGPRSALVTELKSQEEEPLGDMSGFSVKY